MKRDFTKVDTQELKRQLRIHERDNSTITLNEEARRMSIIQQITSELIRRGEAV